MNDRDKAYFQARVSREMDEDLKVPELAAPEALAAAAGGVKEVKIGVRARFRAGGANGRVPMLGFPWMKGKSRAQSKPRKNLF